MFLNTYTNNTALISITQLHYNSKIFRHYRIDAIQIKRGNRSICQVTAILDEMCSYVLIFLSKIKLCSDMEACVYRWLCRRTETCGISKNKNMTQECNVLNTETIFITVV